jgi:hypothetical protein
MQEFDNPSEQDAKDMANAAKVHPMLQSIGNGNRGEMRPGHLQSVLSATMAIRRLIGKGVP